MWRSRAAALLVALLLGVALAACGGDDDPEQAGTDGDAPGSTQVAAPSGERASDTARETPTGGGPILSGDPEQARAGLESVDDVYRGFSEAVDAGIASVDVPARQTLDSAKDDDALARVCDLMSEEAQRQTIVYAKRSAGLAGVEWNCENATGLLLRRARAAGSLKRTLSPKVVGVNVDGDRATASIRFGRRISSVPLVKEDGEWKLAASPSGSG